MSYSVQVEGLDKFQFAKADVLTRQRVVEAMGKATKTVEAEVKPLTPVFQARLRNSIGSTVETSTSTVIGRVGSSLKSETYPAVMEVGRKPGSWPPISALERWAELVLGDVRLAFVVARKIAAQGIKGYFYLKRGLENSKDKINGFFNEALSQLGKDLTNG